MCRRRELYSFCMAAFGLGMLLGKWVDSCFWCGGGGIIFIVLGITMLNRR